MLPLVFLVHAILKIHPPEKSVCLGTDSQGRMDQIRSLPDEG